jgi:serine/threonine-protein kinase
MPSARPVPLGETIGKHRYIAMLAEGGMANVYLAVTQNLGFEKLIVIKQLRAALAEDPSFVAMFMDEARLAARLNHPNVVQTLEVGTDPASGTHFLAMEFLEGIPYVRLARLKDRVPPPLAFHLRILVDVLRGLHYAHELRDFDGTPLSVVHRDVSPQNVMLTFAGGVKVLDFGIAKAELAAEQRPEDFKGKLEYMAPEQAMRKDVDRRADIFSVGVMLFEALTRRRLYRKGDPKHEMLVQARLPNVLEVAPTAPKRLAAICDKAMASDPDDRYATADAMADDIEEWLGNTTQHVSARDVGSYVAEKFEGTRKRIATAIEEQLARIRSMPDTAPDTMPLSRLPSTDVPPEISDAPPPMSIPPGLLPMFPQSDASIREASRVSGPYQSAMPWNAQLGLPPPPPPIPMPEPTARMLTGSNDVATVIGTSTPPVTASTKKPRSAAAATVLFALLLLAGAGAAVFVRVRPKRVEAAPAALVATATATATATELPVQGVAAAPPAGPTDGAQIELTIKASPPEARIFVDGSLMPANPTSATRPRDGAMHLLRIEAPGYEPREEPVGFDRSVFVDVELHSTAPPDPGSVRANKRRTPRPRGSAGAKGIDSENPY